MVPPPVIALSRSGPTQTEIRKWCRFLDSMLESVVDRFLPVTVRTRHCLV